MAIELDYFEYPSNVAIQAAYVTDGGLVYGSDVFTGGTPSASEESAGNVASRAVDGNEVTYWAAWDTWPPHWWKYDLGNGNEKTARKLRIKPYHDPAGAYVKDFTLQGSNNDSDWDVLLTDQHANNINWEDYTFANATAYRYYKINITTNWTDDPVAIGILILETELMEVTGKELQCYSEDTIKEQGSYSLKAIAVQTDSLNDTLTKTLVGGDKIDLSGIDTLKIWAYASRTGTNITVAIHDSGGTTTTINIVITQANTWTEITADISAVTDANKDDIDSIIIKVIEAGAINTFYIDNFYGVEIPVWPISRLNKNRISGYHCFMDAHMRAQQTGHTPLKLPDGTVF